MMPVRVGDADVLLEARAALAAGAVCAIVSVTNATRRRLIQIRTAHGRTCRGIRTKRVMGPQTGTQGQTASSGGVRRSWFMLGNVRS